MKRIFFLAIGALSLSLCAFVVPPKGNNIKRLGQHDYSISSGAVFTEDEKTQISELIQQRYHIMGMQLTGDSYVNLESSDRAAFWAVDKSIGPDWITTRCVYIPSAVAAPRDPATVAVDRILAKYADNN